jgi:tRNA threonylcarbamoyladenosine biosynthesis protein TsaB
MKILALDTSTEYCSVALWQDGAVTERCELVGQKHSEILLEMLDRVLQDSGFRIQDMDGIAFGKGPGSFTGVRIACGVAQGLALGADLPVAGICTLQALAEASGKPRVIAALDARMGEIYHAAYEKHDNTWITVSEPCLCKPENAPAVPCNGWFGAGSAFAAYGDILNAHYAGQLQGTDDTAIPQAGAIAALGAIQFAQGRGVDAAQALPLYLRDKVALKTSERTLTPLRAAPLKTRVMTPADVDAVLAIEQAVQRFPWTCGNFIDALNSGYLCYVDDDGTGVRGYAILMPCVGEAELLNIGVAKTAQRKGLGRALLKEMLATASNKNMKRVFLEVRPSNLAAIALYRRAGFAEIGVRHNYYRNGAGSEDAIVMAHNLTGGHNG